MKEEILSLPQATAEKTYRAIGRFIYEFSQTEYTLRALLKGQIGLEGRFFTPILQTFDVAALCNVCKRVFEMTLSAKDFEAVEKLINAFLKANTERVRVAHGLWTPQIGGGMVHHVSKSSMQLKAFNEQAELLEKLADEIRDMRREMFKAVDLSLLPDADGNI